MSYHALLTIPLPAPIYHRFALHQASAIFILDARGKVRYLNVVHPIIHTLYMRTYPPFTVSNP